ncbi:MAG TPA: TatD family hydrolase [Cytophagales bacterium]|nr:TatD family hydrolase [Cytophagales bacterium]
MEFIDSHAHIYQSELKATLEDVLFRSHSNNVSKVVMPNVDSSSIEDMLDCEARFPGVCYATIGLHPCYVKENYRDELNIVRGWLDKRDFCAIGEIGIDLYHDTTFAEAQEESFIQQVEWALEKDLPVIIHTRSAFYEAVRILKKLRHQQFKGVFHCFGGSIQDAETVIKMGFKLGIGGTVTYKNSGLNEVLKEIDLSHLLVETDAPYLTPVPYRGKPNEPSYIPLVAQKIAEIKNITVDEVAKATTRNAKDLFRI